MIDMINQTSHLILHVNLTKSNISNDRFNRLSKNQIGCYGASDKMAASID